MDSIQQAEVSEREEPGMDLLLLAVPLGLRVLHSRCCLTAEKYSQALMIPVVLEAESDMGLYSSKHQAELEDYLAELLEVADELEVAAETLEWVGVTVVVHKALPLAAHMEMQLVVHTQVLLAVVQIKMLPVGHTQVLPVGHMGMMLVAGHKEESGAEAAVAFALAVDRIDLQKVAVHNGLQ